MKNYMLFFALLMFMVVNLNAQDIITKQNGDDIKAKVLEISDTEILYKKYDLLDGPTYTEKKSEILIIRYENGMKDIFLEEQKENEGITKFDADGRADAKIYYTGRNSGAGWTGATTFLFSPLIGVIPAIACSATTPKDFNLNYPDKDLMRDYNYSNNYKKEARRIKRNKVWGGAAIGSIAWLGLFYLGGSF